MFHLLYVSAAREPFGKAQLIELLEKARSKNARLGITGMLLYKGGDFMQLLEGDEASVRALFDTIRRDPRHQHCLVVFEEAVGERLFADWAMGFRGLDDAEVRSLPGFSEFMSRYGELAGLRGLRGRPDACLELLRVFAAGR